MEIMYLIALIAVFLFLFAAKNANLGKNKKIGDGTLKSKTPLTRREVDCIGEIRKALPELEVMSQVGFSAFLRVVSKDKKQRMSIFNKISRKRCDFLICDEMFKPLCIIELDDSSHDRNKDKIRDDLVRSAGIKTIRIKEVSEASKLQYGSRGVSIGYPPSELGIDNENKQ